MEEKTESFTRLVMIGMSVFGTLLDKDPSVRGTALALIVTGKYERELKAVSFFKQHRRNPLPDEDWMNDSSGYYEYVVNYCRNIIQGIFDRAENEMMLQKQAEFANLKEQLAQTNKPHPKGSVAELATKLGKSKNEIRRMKAEGVLDAAIQAAGI